MKHFSEPLSFGQLLGALRERHELRQADVAAEMKCARAYISQVERDIKTPSSTWLDRLIIALGASESEAEALIEAAELSRGMLKFPDEMPVSLRRQFVRLTRSKGQPGLSSWSLLERKLSSIASVSE